eukprot:scaffold4658_cov118-Cylindrotheca_fusiformis.AAC.8
MQQVYCCGIEAIFILLFEKIIVEHLLVVSTRHSNGVSPYHDRRFHICRSTHSTAVWPKTIARCNQYWVDSFDSYLAQNALHCPTTRKQWRECRNQHATPQ